MMRDAITGGSVNLYDHLKAKIQKATEIKLIVSFVMESGVRLSARVPFICPGIWEKIVT